MMQVITMAEEIRTWIAECHRLRQELAAAQLTLATLCDIVLGEDATDRSDDALIRAVRALKGWG